MWELPAHVLGDVAQPLAANPNPVKEPTTALSALLRGFGQPDSAWGQVARWLVVLGSASR